MLLLLQIAAIAAGATPALTPEPRPWPPNRAALAAAAKPCPNAKTWLTDRAPGVAGPKKLNELPPAEAYYAVHRSVDGCLTPIKVGEAR